MGRHQSVCSNLNYERGLATFFPPCVICICAETLPRFLTGNTEVASPKGEIFSFIRKSLSFQALKKCRRSCTARRASCGNFCCHKKGGGDGAVPFRRPSPMETVARPLLYKSHPRERARRAGGRGWSARGQLTRRRPPRCTFCPAAIRKGAGSTPSTGFTKRRRKWAT